MIDRAGGVQADLTLDVAGFPCPLPVLKAKKALAGLSAGAVLEIIASDPASVEDFEALCRTTGDRLRDKNEQAGLFRFLIEKAGGF
jgi:tRNA 2-thiouridine synthesizing protein A